MSATPPLAARVLHWLLGSRWPLTEIDPCTITVDGKPIRALEGQSLAAVLVHSGLWDFQHNLVSGEPRGPYCGMGVCFECEVMIDGARARRACLTGVRAGMVIHTHPYRGPAPA